MLCLLPCFIFLLWGIYLNRKVYQEQKNLLKSYQLQRTIEYLKGFPQLKYTEIKRLQKIRSKLKHKEKQKKLHQIIYAYQHKQKYILKKHIKQFIDKEKKRNLQIKKIIQHSSNQYQFSLIGFFMSLFMGILFYALFLKKKFFKPLQKIEETIHAFIRGEYTYKFQKLEKNEVGNLYASFHSLAQIITHQIDKLKQLDRAKSKFVNIASHELRTPLTSIKGSLNLISTFIKQPQKDQNDSSKFNKQQLEALIFIAEEETNRVIRMVNQLLDIAKIETGKFQLNKEWCFIHELIESCIESVYGLSQKAKIKIKHRPQKKLEEFKDQIQIFGDFDCLKQVMINLLSNAIKHSHFNQEVQIKWSIDENGEFKIEVKDEGPGIEKKLQSKIFDKFIQATKSDTHSKLMKSTGLGLTISKALIEEHGGKIGFISKEKEGSTFYFILPKWQFYKNLPIQEEEKEEIKKIAS